MREFHAQVAERCGRDPASEATPAFMTQSAAAVARRVIRDLRRPSPQVWPQRVLHLLSGFWMWFPRFRCVCMRGVARHGRRALEDMER